ncbi:hypothetical protein E2C01_005228 [Portunus trituberculatus]|uniref:Uncharacterized protein n=1 Tax=Portunus trituberculatus TaxID=210409 RepID=A0A5B7CST1_PORTR|nr:hypothetical protein [Portunus trituberculatus]
MRSGSGGRALLCLSSPAEAVRRPALKAREPRTPFRAKRTSPELPTAHGAAVCRAGYSPFHCFTAGSHQLVVLSDLGADKGLFPSPPPRRKIDAAVPSRASQRLFPPPSMPKPLLLSSFLFP